MKIPLSNRPDLFAEIDEDDFEKVRGYIWTFAGGYAIRSKRCSEKRGLNLAMHRIIAACPEELCVHHVNFDKLDNRKVNLLICTKEENSARKPYQTQKGGIPVKGKDLQRLEDLLAELAKEIPEAQEKIQEISALIADRKPIYA